MEPPPADKSLDEPTRSSVEPLSLLPSRLPLLWLVPAVAASAAAIAMAFGNPYATFLTIILTATPVYMVALVVKLLVGRTGADADGIRNRTAFRTRFLPWSDVARLSVAGTLFGRVTMVHLTGGKQHQLAAPRSGLLGRDRGFDATVDAMAALAPSPPPVDRTAVRGMRITWWALLAIMLTAATWLARPWLEPWWPGRHEAASLPGACAVADEATARRLLPDVHDAQERNRTYGIGSECSYRSRAGADLKVELLLLERSSSIGATGKARGDHLHERRVSAEQAQRFADGHVGWTFEAQDVTGIGDQAWRRILVDTRDGRVDVRLFVRYANVLIEVDYDADRPENETIAAADELARRAVERIETR